jgi:hypothetical protein
VLLGSAPVKSLCKMLVKSTPGANLINIQRRGLRLRLKKASRGTDSGLRLAVIF